MKPTALAPFLLLSVLVFATGGIGANIDVTKGGNITVLDMAQFNISASWSGYYGDLLVSENPIAGWVVVSNLSVLPNVTEQNFPLRCDRYSGYLLISNESTLPDINNLAPGSLAALDWITGSVDSGSNTFTVNTTFVIAGHTITNVPTTYPHVNSASQSTYFRQGYMTDGSARIFVAEINQDTVGFDGARHDFQFMLPYELGANYYVFVLFSCQWCGDGVCMSGESCRTCPDDCGVCEEEEEEPKESELFILTPPTHLVLYPVEDITMRITLDRQMAYVGETITGIVFIDYWGSQNIDAYLVLSIDGIPFARFPVSLRAPITSLQVPFDLIAHSTGHHEIVATLEGFVEVLGKTMAETEFVAIGPGASTCPLGDTCLGAQAGAASPCRFFGIDCIIVIIILILTVIFLIALKKRRRRGPKKSNRLLEKEELKSLSRAIRRRR